MTAMPARHASSAAPAAVVFIDPSVMHSPWRRNPPSRFALRRGPPRRKKKGREIAAPMSSPNELCPRLLSGRRRLAEVRGPINFLARVSHGDLRALGEVHVRVAALDHATNEGNRHARLDCLWAPAKLLDQLLRTTELRGPTRRFATVVDVEDDEGVRVHHDELH